MPKTKSAKKPARKSAKSVRKSASTNGARKRSATARRSSSNAAGSGLANYKVREGIITHTELASTNPLATRAWLENVLRWTFGEPTPSPAGPYHMWRFEELGTGGGLRVNNGPENPGSVPYVEVKNMRTVYARALAAGATEMMPPMELPGGMGSIAVIMIPGGIQFGFWSPK